MSRTSSTPMPATGSLRLVEAVIGPIEGAPIGEHRRWSDEFKAQAVAAALEPGVNVSALARRLGLSPARLFGWRQAFLKKQDADITAVTEPSLVEIVMGAVTIRVGSNVSKAALRRILRAVRSA